MTENNTNTWCKICGKGYHVCNSCMNIKTFRPWRTITDTMEHYKIYLAIHGYTISKDKKTAKSQLQNCDLSDFASLKDEIKSAIEEIMTVS